MPIASRRATCLLYTSDAADDLIGVDLGGIRIWKKKREFELQVILEGLMIPCCVITHRSVTITRNLELT